MRSQATPAPRLARSAPVLGLTVGHDATLVTYRPAGSRTPVDLPLAVVPDHGACRRLRAALRRVSWVAIDVTGAVPVCRVAAVQRRPVELTVPVAVGLGLIDEGARGVVRTREVVGR